MKILDKHGFQRWLGQQTEQKLDYMELTCMHGLGHCTTFLHCQHDITPVAGLVPAAELCQQHAAGLDP